MQRKEFERLNEVLSALQKKYPKVLRTGEDIEYTRRVPFGEPMLDYISDGGVPFGRFTEFIGLEHSGKTRNALRLISRFQRYCLNCGVPEVLEARWEVENGIPKVMEMSCKNCGNPRTKACAVVDLEHTIDRRFMELMEVDANGVIYTVPDLPSVAVNMTEALIRNEDIGVVVFDSFGVMGSDREVETPIEEYKMNQNPAFMNMAFRKWQAALNAALNESGRDEKVVIVVNQTYTTLGMYPQDVPQGGRGLRHGKALSLKTDIVSKMKDGGEVFGVHIRMRNEKNKAGIPYRQGEYVLHLGKEEYCKTNVGTQYVEVGVLLGVIEQMGAWFTWGGRKWQGKMKMVEDLGELEEMITEIKERLYKKERGGVTKMAKRKKGR